MKTVYLSSFCVGFRDYPLLEEIIQQTEGAGVELATSWNYPEFDPLLDAQQSRFHGIPTTLHAPFVEICGAPDSSERRAMEQSFEKAFRWYDLFHATSMVMHTHEKRVTPEDKPRMMEYARAAILHTAGTARARGAHLTVENVGYPAKGTALFTQEEFAAFIESLPDDVGALIDIGHAMANQWDIPALVRTLGSRIHGYHLHNTDGVHDLHRPLLEMGLWYDKARMTQLMETIVQYSPEADMVLEYAPGAHITAALMRSDTQWVQQFWK